MNGIRENQTSALSCIHSTTEVERFPAHSPHWGRLVCAACGAQVKILPKPSNESRWKRNAACLKIMRDAGLTDQELEQIGIVDETKVPKLGPAQQEALDSIFFDFLEKVVYPIIRERKGAK
jgi:hypothetical protein